MKKDPVCNMNVKEDEAVTAKCEGAIYYFCSDGCRDKFLKEKECKQSRTSYDFIIIGGGPAGLTAAIYAATLKMDALLITKDLGGQAVDSTKIENYMGFDFITGPELIEKFQRQLVHSHYIDHLMSEVEKIEPAGQGFHITTSGLNKYSAKALLVATGMTRRRLNVPGEERFQRRGVFYGNIQDLSFAKLTADPSAVQRIRTFKNLHIYEDFKVVEFSGEGALSHITVRKRAEAETVSIPVKGVFIAIGLQPNSSLLSHLIDLNERGEIIINPDCSTSHPGLFAAGDVTDAFGKRIIISCGEGAKAALAARQLILNMKKRKEE